MQPSIDLRPSSVPAGAARPKGAGLLASLFLALALTPQWAAAAALGAVSGGEITLPRDDLTEARRDAIKATLAAKIATLRSAGRIPALSSKLAPSKPLEETPPFPLQWPLQLVPGHPEPAARTVINYVDHNPAYPGQVLDYNCGDRTYDQEDGYNHQGTDITAYPFAWRKMDDDEAIVVAAAPGIILSKMDGQYDRSCVLADQPWNAVYVMHADGSVAWYGHLKSGSLTSKNDGDWVQAGEFLGVMGSSGDSTGPHLHFELYDADGNLVDPFAGACNNFNSSAWWAEQRPYNEPAIDLVMTGDAPIDFSPCPTPEVEHRSSYFQPGQTVYLTGFFTDQIQADSVVFTVFTPDGSVFATTTIPSNAAYYAASYWESFVTLPADAENGTWRFAVAFHGDTQSVDFQVGATEPPRTDIVEYYAPSLDHYFMTGFADEEAALDAGTPIAGWFRTGESFPAYSADGDGLATVCRFFGTPGLGVNSHFYTAFDFECAAVKQEPGWIFEANAFYIAANVSQCPASTRPVFRLYNNGMGGEPNHRYTTSWPIIDSMQTDGWALEGVAFCAPL
ncbi:MAG TPA: peptidoglycan DD-metalloendopeptidase family protein [Casimicrobiaceae bacterium]|nr:peptidoglycan DD-metalloendopeptidase family protein [Casimicrobiaceae bacterium]